MAESSHSQSNEQTELTMMDVLEEEQELEEDANAVLGGSDDTNCSYDKGYLPRQALYACTTCSDNQEPGGVCLACSYKCHDGHEIVELYTKRNFRCDCGNGKFPGKTCSLKSDKEPTNPLNKYNQNFKGLYCICSRPYPDLEDNTPDEMIQCVVCEDWHHGRHIGGHVPADYSEMICAKCMESRKFLYSYLNKFNYVNVDDNREENEKCNGSVKSECTDAEMKIENETSSVHNQDHTITGSIKEVPDSPAVKEELKTENETAEGNQNLSHLNGNVEKGDLPTAKVELASADQNVKSEIEMHFKQEVTVKSEEPDECGFKKLVVKPDGITSGPAFWPENWRKELCHCSSCMDMYLQHECAYLINLDDTILAYEERGKSVCESQYDKGLSALSQLDRVKQMEAVRAYTNMKGQLKEYLKEFANNKRTVCESDIKEFFDRISKRQKFSNNVPHFCR